VQGEGDPARPIRSIAPGVVGLSGVAFFPPMLISLTDKFSMFFDLMTDHSQKLK
jgi:hypothetical protein